MLFKRDVEVLLKMYAVLLLVDVDKVNDANDVDKVNSLTVLDEQGDVEVNLCDLL